MKCENCGVEVDLPFRCNYCEHYYCPLHRLPENHDCVESWRVKAIRSARAAVAPIQIGSEVRSVLLPPQRSGLHFSGTEARHLLLGTALVTAAGISFFLGNPLSIGIIGIVISSALFSLGFILHELAHKYVAQTYGLWAEFRLNTTGLLLTAISVFSPLKFIAPGAVVIAGFADKVSMGKTAFAGPLVNIVISLALLAALPAFAQSEIYHALVAGAAINAFLALFNLIPFAIFDGKKVFVWAKLYWAALFGASLALTIYSSFILGP